MEPSDCRAVIRLCDRTLLYSICTCKRTVSADGISYRWLNLVDKGIGISNTLALCGKELNESYCGTENDVIISCGGGELMCEVVPYIDFAGIAQAKPKWYMGFPIENMIDLKQRLIDLTRERKI